MGGAHADGSVRPQATARADASTEDIVGEFLSGNVAPALPDPTAFWTAPDRGRDCRRIDPLVLAYLAARSVGADHARDAVATYRQWIATTLPFAEDLRAELEDLARYATAFRRLHRGLREDPHELFFDRLRAMRSPGAGALVLRILADPRVAFSDRDGMLHDLDSHFVRRMLCNRLTAGDDPRLLELLHESFAEAASSRDILRTLLAAEPTFALGWPMAAEFERAWKAGGDAHRLMSSRVWGVLESLDLAQRTSPRLRRLKGVPHYVRAPRSEDDAEATSFGNLTFAEPSDVGATIATRLQGLSPDLERELTPWFIGRTTWSDEDIEKRTWLVFEAVKTAWPQP